MVVFPDRLMVLCFEAKVSNAAASGEEHSIRLSWSFSSSFVAPVPNPLELATESCLKVTNLGTP